MIGVFKMSVKFRNDTANKYADILLLDLYCKINGCNASNVPPSWVKTHHRDVENILREAFAQVADDAQIR